jgi:hypothetical protein
MTVEYWTRPEKPSGNYNIRFAKVGAIEFCALPFQDYYCRLGKFSARIAHVYANNQPDYINVFISRCNSDGTSTTYKYESFFNEDKAFIWAANKLAALQ